MQYLKNYNSFKKENSVNEELLGSLLKAASGALKNFITGISAPFKNLSADFKKGMKLEEAKKKMTATVEQVLKSAVDNINKAKDENEINQIKDGFSKSLDEKIAEFDKEIKTIKESAIFEGAVQDAMIGGRVLFGIFKDQMAALKMDFDKKFAAAKDLAAKKQVAIQELKTAVEGFKKKIADENLVKQATDKYKQENKITTSGGSEDVLKSYGVDKIDGLVGKEVRYKKKGFDPNKKEEDQEEMVAKLKVLKATADGVILDGKEEDFEKKIVDLLPAEKANPADADKEKVELQNKVKAAATKDAKNVAKLSKVADILAGEDEAKKAEVEKIIGGEEAKTEEQ